MVVFFVILTLGILGALTFVLFPLFEKKQRFNSQLDKETCLQLFEVYKMLVPIKGFDALADSMPIRISNTKPLVRQVLQDLKFLSRTYSSDTLDYRLRFPELTTEEAIEHIKQSIQNLLWNPNAELTYRSLFEQFQRWIVLDGKQIEIETVRVSGFNDPYYYYTLYKDKEETYYWYLQYQDMHYSRGKTVKEEQDNDLIRQSELKNDVQKINELAALRFREFLKV